jgi:hypothetical protein
MSNEERVTIGVETLNEVLGLLSQQPYNSVANVIQKVQQDVKPLMQGVDSSAPEVDQEAG